MPEGPGKYDDLATHVRTEAHAEGVVLIVLRGARGSGFSVQATADVSAFLSALLRQVADEMDRARS